MTEKPIYLKKRKGKKFVDFIMDSILEFLIIFGTMYFSFTFALQAANKINNPDFVFILATCVLIILLIFSSWCKWKSFKKFKE